MKRAKNAKGGTRHKSGNLALTVRESRFRLSLAVTSKSNSEEETRAGRINPLRYRETRLVVVAWNNLSVMSRHISIPELVSNKDRRGRAPILVREIRRSRSRPSSLEGRDPWRNGRSKWWIAGETTMWGKKRAPFSSEAIAAREKTGPRPISRNSWPCTCTSAVRATFRTFADLSFWPLSGSYVRERRSERWFGRAFSLNSSRTGRRRCDSETLYIG